jgi:transcriptional regulator with XRE-family HTH domain
MLTPAQLRAARALLGWSQDALAEKCGGVRHLSTIKRFESGRSDPKQSTLLAWRRALSKAGVVFIDPDGTHGPGVMLRHGKHD